jgi:putative flippase GtrA
MSTSFSNLAILIPTYNPNQNLYDLLIKVSSYQWNQIVVVNDGSSSINSNELLDQIKDINNVNVINHPSNQGKGSALKTGIEFLKNNENNIDGVITVDSDGQHQLEDILKVGTSSVSRKDDVLFGVRSFDDGTPLRSKFGNKLTKYLLYIFNGISIDDSQTGLRYMPTSLFGALLNLPGNRYEFELECLFTIKNLGYNITQIPIKTIYIDDNSDSHFRPILDSAKIYLVFARFSLSSLLSFGLDITIFAILLSFLDSILISTVLARILSGIFNFSINRTIVFRSSNNNSLLKDALGYIVLWAILVIFSGLIVSTAQGLDAYLIIPFKILIDLLLFIIAFYVQKNIVFKSR